MIAATKRERIDNLRRIGTATLWPSRPKLAVGCATCGAMVGAEAVFEAIAARVRKTGLDLRVTRTGCTGHCAQEPLVHVEIPGRPRVTYGRVTTDKARDLVDAVGRGELPAEGVLQSLDREENLLDQSVHVWGPPDKKLAGPHPSTRARSSSPQLHGQSPQPEEYRPRRLHGAGEGPPSMTPEQVIDAVGPGPVAAAAPASTGMKCLPRRDRRS